MVAKKKSPPKKAAGKRSPTAHRTPAQTRAHGKGYQSTPEQIAKRSKRNQARAKMKKKVGAAAIAGKDIDHKTPLKKGGSNATSNLRVATKKKNRGHGTSGNGR